MEARIAKWGNSLAVRLPRSVIAGAKLHDGHAVELSVESGRVVIAPRAQRFTLKRLLSGVTSVNLHQSIDAGPAVGREAW